MTLHCFYVTHFALSVRQVWVKPLMDLLLRYSHFLLQGISIVLFTQYYFSYRLCFSIQLFVHLSEFNLPSNSLAINYIENLRKCEVLLAYFNRSPLTSLHSSMTKVTGTASSQAKRTVGIQGFLSFFWNVGLKCHKCSFSPLFLHRFSFFFLCMRMVEKKSNPRFAPVLTFMRETDRKQTDMTDRYI